MNRPEWLLDVPSEEYHAATKRGEYLSSHRLNVFRRCPLEYKKLVDGEIIEKDTASFMLGRATHVYVLEGEKRFAAEFNVSDGPVNEKTGKPYGKQTETYKNWQGSQIKPFIGSDDFEIIKKMRESVMMHQKAWELLSDGIAEATIRTEWDMEKVQCRMDWFNQTTGDIVDLKTCADIDKFRYDVRDFGYAFQLAFYQRCVELAGYDKSTSCWLVAVEKKEPYRCCVVRISDATLWECNVSKMANETLDEANGKMISELRKCKESGIWPTRYEQVITI